MCCNTVRGLQNIYNGVTCRYHQDSAGMVTTDWVKFHERKDNGLVSDVFNSESRMRKLPGGPRSLRSSLGRLTALQRCRGTAAHSSSPPEQTQHPIEPANSTVCARLHIEACTAVCGTGLHLGSQPRHAGQRAHHCRNEDRMLNSFS